MNRRTLILSFSIFLTLITVSLFGFLSPRYFKDQTNTDSNYMLLIDLNTMICPICLGPLEKFMDDLRMKEPSKVIGIVVCDQSFPLSERNERIINRQIRGFMTGFNLSFPVYIDYKGHFSQLKQNGPCLIELNNSNRQVIKKDLIPERPKL